jgi:hypothetical protein
MLFNKTAKRKSNDIHEPDTVDEISQHQAHHLTMQLFINSVLKG